jgi:8-oxo-dGTP diphosphatase
MSESDSSPKQKWKQEFSAGGVVYKTDNNRIFILLINPCQPNYGPPADYWTFPKGRLDGEAKDVAALREVREEGGVRAEIEADLGSVKYFRQSKDYGNAIKFVSYFLMKYQDGNPEDHDREVAEAQWFPLEEAGGKLKYPTDKEIFNKAKIKLSS